MNVQDALGQAGRLIGDVHRQAREYLSGNPETEEPSAGELWEKASPDLDKALAVYDERESPDTPESTWNPFRRSKEGCQKDLDKLLDGVLVILGTCGAAGYRGRIRDLQTEIEASRTQIAKCREQILSAPAEQSQNFVEGLVVSSKEALKDQISDETDRMAERSRQVENLKVGFREHLQQIGVSVSPETADSFLLPIQDDIVSMAAVISNIGRVTEQLQQLVDQSREAAAQTKRYYGIYVLLVLAVDRIQTHFVREIDGTFLPRLRGFENEGVQNIASAKVQISRGGPQEQLLANITAGNKTIHACRLLAELLQSQKRSVLDENRSVQTLLAASVNSYRTVRLSNDIADLIGRCDAAFRSLRELRLPQLRTFQNVRLNEELQRLAERMAEKG
jgi:hypothetical protein